jgi:hypothetical protein
VLNGGPADPLTVRVRAFGATHFLPIGARMSLLGQHPDIELTDELWPVAAGSHTLEVMVFPAKGGEPLLERRIRFTIAAPKPPDKDLDGIRDRLAGLAESMERAEREYATARRSRRTVAPGTAAPGDTLRARRLDEFFGRVRAYADVAEVMERQLQPERALQALRFAQQIFESERETAGIHPERPGDPTLDVPRRLTPAPAHLAALARFHTRRGDLEQALASWRQEADWYDRQARRSDLDPKDRRQCAGPDEILGQETTCVAKASLVRWRMADTHFLLRADRAAYEALIAEGRKVGSP